jgi:hypothetical protein
MAKYHIEKSQQIQGQENTIYYQDTNRWTTVFQERKKYTRKADATKELSFGGIIVTE